MLAVGHRLDHVLIRTVHICDQFAGFDCLGGVFKL